MRMRRAQIILMVGLCAALLPLGCKKRDKTGGGAAASASPAKAYHWVAQYRPKGSFGAGSYGALYSFGAISVLSPSVVYAAGNYPDPKDKGGRIPVVAKTTDGGASWAELTLPEEAHKVSRLNAIKFTSPSTGWAAGGDDNNDGFILRTTDGGATWSVSSLPIKLVPTSIYSDGAQFWMGGAAAKPGEDEDSDDGPSDILVSSDQGINWSPQYHLPCSVFDLNFVDSQTGWAAGNPAALYHTTDGGRTWDSQQTGLSAPIGVRAKIETAISGVSFCDPLHGWIAGGSDSPIVGVVESTTDGGNTWSLLWKPDGENIHDILFLNQSEGWVVSSNGLYVYHSADAGRTWQVEPVTADQQPSLNRLGAADPAHVWAVGGGGIFYREAQ